MEREEAIEELYRIVENQYRSAEKDKEAINMAIKALEQEPFMNKLCISGGVCEHDKMQAFDKVRAEILDEAMSHSGTGEEVIQAYVDGLNRAIKVIDKYKMEGGDKNESVEV